MKEIVLWGVIAILLVGYIFLIRFFKKNESNQKSFIKLIDSMKLESEKLKTANRTKKYRKSIFIN